MVTQAFNIKNNMSMLVQKSQDHKKAKDHKMMIRDYAWLMILKKLKIHIQVKPIRTSSSLKSMITTTYHKLKIEVKDYEPKTKGSRKTLITLRLKLPNLGVHFARECRAPRSKEGQFRNQDNTRKQGNNEDTSSKEMLAIDGVGFDWSDMAEEQVQTNMALMAFSDSEVYTDKTCSKTCLKNYETLKKQCDDLIVKLNQAKFIAATYKRGLAIVEAQLITYRKNDVLFSEEVAVLKREVACKDY
ncbi:hypothetical protein Tco_0748478 [Tanacetum coccineum]|uniref:Uncharacterized protein n=1 Tax=Tanacetum coccineum TaxID=301880 RepID=A0ABQ4YYG5_9ASTR